METMHQSEFNPSEVEAFVAGLENVEREEAYGYTFYFVGDDHRLPFVTLADSDNEYDSVSNLNREGVFRINIGVSKATFDALVGDRAAGAESAGAIDYTALNVYLPHPEYARQHFVCILNPVGENAERTQQLIIEAHALAAGRAAKRSRGQE